MKKTVCLLVLGFLAGCAATSTQTTPMTGAAVSGAAASQALSDASEGSDIWPGSAKIFTLLGGRQVELTNAQAAQIFLNPLGSDANPVRAELPEGQRAYLARLRCSDGSAPDFVRVGSYGAGPFSTIIDGYALECPDFESPAMVFMDMYHRGHVEACPVKGFAIVPAIAQEASGC